MYLYLSLKRIITAMILTGFLMGSGLLSHDTQPQEMPLFLSSVSQRVDAEADRDDVWVLRQSESTTEPLLKRERTFLHVGDGVNVDRRGRAILRFSDALTVEVMRNGKFELQALHVEPESLVLQMRQQLGIFFNDLPPYEKIARRVVVETDFAIITATGTQFLIVRESSTGLEWVIVLEASEDVLVTSKATRVTVPVSAGWARWIAPTGDLSAPIPYDQQAVRQWLEGWRAGVPEPRDRDQRDFVARRAKGDDDTNRDTNRHPNINQISSRSPTFKTIASGSIELYGFTNADSDRNPYAPSAGRGIANSDLYANTNQDLYTDANASDLYADADGHADVNTNQDLYTDANSNLYTDADRHADANSNANTNQDPNQDLYTDANSNLDTDADHYVPFYPHPNRSQGKLDCADGYTNRDGIAPR